MVGEGRANKAGKPISKSYFYTTLTNELHAGWIIKFGERHRGTFAPIVSDDLFQRIQRVLRRKAIKHSVHLSEHPDFPLRKFVFDSSGRALTGSWQRTVPEVSILPLWSAGYLS